MAFQQAGRQPPRQRGAPAHPLGHHRSSEVLACPLDSGAPDQDAGARGPSRLAISEPYLPHQPPPSPDESTTSSIVPSDHADISK
jgi:hypothetical protein